MECAGRARWVGDNLSSFSMFNLISKSVLTVREEETLSDMVAQRCLCVAIFVVLSDGVRRWSNCEVFFRQRGPREALGSPGVARVDPSIKNTIFAVSYCFAGFGGILRTAWLTLRKNQKTLRPQKGGNALKRSELGWGTQSPWRKPIFCNLFLIIYQ